MKCILIVDDDTQVRQIVKIFLTRQGYEVDEVDNGADALWAIERNKPDLVLLDIGMPGISGLAVLQRVKKKHPDLKVIMLTGLNQEEVWKKAMKAGATDYITKPFSFEQLRMNITVHLP